MLQLSIVHRLPQHFRWASDRHSAIESDDLTLDEQDFVALRLISHDGMPCLFIQRRDESATNCCLKNQGVAIAETFITG